LFVPRRALLQILEQNPGVAAHVLRVLSGRVRRFALLAADLSLRDTTQRVAAHILRETERAGGNTVALESTREELATRLGTVREEVSRALSQLRDQGILDVAGRRIRVLDAKRLRARAGDDA
jgi:CRP-like cAMP-binding protein